MAVNQSPPTSERSALLPTTSPDEATSHNQDRAPGPCFGPSCLFPLASHQKADALVEDENGAPSDEEGSTSWAQYAVSVALLGLCVGLCTAGILYRQTPMAIDVGPVLTIALMWALIWWLGILEGAQGCLVGLQPVPTDQYRHTHDYTYACTQLAHRGDNLNRFIVGRQFFVVLMVFLLNLVCTAVEGSVVPGVPPALFSGLVASGLAVMIITVMLGQLSAEVNATNCMFDFVNSRVVWVTTWMCLAIEASGLLHSVYLIQTLFGFFSPEAGIDNSKKSPGERVWYWTRMAVSTVLLAAAVVVTCDALWHDETTMIPSPRTVVSFAVFLGFVCSLGILEAIQIAAFAVVKLPPRVVEENPAAEAGCKMVFSGRNFKAVLIGRQILVTTSMFFLARITTTNVHPEDVGGTMSTVLGIPPSVQAFFNTGLPGALITTIVASLWWRIAAATFPIGFMANPVVHWTIRFCLFLEATGVFSASLLLSDGLRWMMGLKPDDVYLAIKNMSDDLECGTSEESTLLATTSSEDESMTTYTTPTYDIDSSGKSKAGTVKTRATSGSDSIRSEMSFDALDDMSTADGVPKVGPSWDSTPVRSHARRPRCVVGNIQEVDCSDRTQELVTSPTSCP